MTSPLGAAHAVTKLPAQNLDRARRFYRDRLGLDVTDQIVTVPNNYPSKGTGERGAFFFDGEGNLLGLGQATGHGNR